MALNCRRMRKKIKSLVSTVEQIVATLAWSSECFVQWLIKEIGQEGYKYLEFTETEKTKEKKNERSLPDRIFKKNLSCFTVETKWSQQD